jgi:ABC-2 type transport system ATP-binding protein
MQLAIEATGLTKSFGSVKVLTGVDILVPRGTVFSLLGPNGAGKTTTVRILGTLAAPDGGTARVAGFDVVRQRHEVRRRISLTGQYAAVDDLQTGRENVRMIGRLLGLPGKEARRRSAELIERLDLVEAAGRRVATYSGGMRRRLDLAASMMGRPEVLFLDEPTTGLDPRSRQTVWQLVGELVGEGVTVLLTTQYLDEADQLADRIAVIDRGGVVAEGTPAQLKRQVAEQRLDLTLADPAAFTALAERLGRRVLQHDAARRTLSVATDGTAAHVRDLLDELDPQRHAISSFSVHTATLDDVFNTLTGRPRATESTKETANV